MGLKNITKILALFLSLQLFTSCGLKALVIPNLDWLLKRKLASELSLNSEQKKQLKEDIKVFLEDRKGQAQRLSKKIKKLPLEKLNATKLSEEFFVEYKDFLKAFLPLYSKYLAQLEKEQLKDLEETFAEKNREIKERVDDFDLALRLAFNGKGLHLPINLGYYLNEGLGQSTKPDSKQPIERTVIEMRYNIRVLEPQLMPYTSDYDVENIIVDEQKIPASTYS